MTQTIEQLTARVRELEEFKANVVKECASIIKHAHKDIAKQLAASQAYAEQLREALENHSGNYKLSKAECKIINDLLDKPHDTSALDAYVAEKVKEAGKFDIWKTNPYTKVLETSIKQLTRQRDLAVEALKAIAGRRIFIDNLASNVDIAVMTLDAIKESGAK